MSELWKKLPAVVAILGIVIITNRAMNVEIGRAHV